MKASVNSTKNIAREVRARLVDFLQEVCKSPGPVTLSILKLEDDAADAELKDIPSAIQYLQKAVNHGQTFASSDPQPNRIRFPYSRHSSYDELCQLLQVLKPRDVWPCTVQPVRWIKEGKTPLVVQIPLLETRN